MRRAVLFDLGNTLVRYYQRAEFAPLLNRGIAKVAHHLRADGLLRVEGDVIRRRVAEENHEAADFSVRPMEGRLARIFEVDEGRALPLCTDFMGPIFERASVYEETVPVLRALQAQGVKTGVVSNTPWGCPAGLWREELRRLDLNSYLDTTIFCRDVGWRKPDRRIFERVLQEVGVPVPDCLYVGDNPKWDRAGPATVGMEGILVERGDWVPDGGVSVHDLKGVLGLV